VTTARKEKKERWGKRKEWGKKEGERKIPKTPGLKDQKEKPRPTLVGAGGGRADRIFALNTGPLPSAGQIAPGASSLR